MLRDYQFKWTADVYDAWNAGAFNIIGTAPTGAGKAVMIGNMISELQRPTCVVAHRQELVSQLALTMNREKIPHSIMAPNAVIRQIVALEMDTHGETHYKSSAPTRVASVNTLVARGDSERWFKQVEYAFIDEGHHVLRENIWGQAMGLFPNARGLFPTAHALRADGCGLGRHADGLADSLVLGPNCRDLINRGFLTDYRLICPRSDIDVSDVPITATGDFSTNKLRKKVHESKTIIGDIVSHYLRHAGGKLGLTFAVDVEEATKIAAAYRAAGVSAQVITAKTPIPIRAKLMREFRERRILQLVNVDVLGEGVDVPAIEVVSLARHTASFQLYSQQCGRALRPQTGHESTWDSWTDEQRLAAIAVSIKPQAIIIDHVNNYERLGLFDKPRTYTLDRREKRTRRTPDDDEIPLRVCTNIDCLFPYEAFLTACPRCGVKPPVRGRSSPDHVDGDLIELSPDTLKELRGEIARVDGPAYPPANVSKHVAAVIHRNHAHRQRTQLTLRSAISLWAGWLRAQGRSDSEIYRKFFFRFRTDVASAQTLGPREATELEGYIRNELDRNGVIPA